jgi:hypothetical protein
MKIIFLLIFQNIIYGDIAFINEFYNNIKPIIGLDSFNKNYLSNIYNILYSNNKEVKIKSKQDNKIETIKMDKLIDLNDFIKNISSNNINNNEEIKKLINNLKEIQASDYFKYFYLSNLEFYDYDTSSEKFKKLSFQINGGFQFYKKDTTDIISIDKKILNVNINKGTYIENNLKDIHKEVESYKAYEIGDSNIKFVKKEITKYVYVSWFNMLFLIINIIMFGFFAYKNNIFSKFYSRFVKKETINI